MKVFQMYLHPYSQCITFITLVTGIFMTHDLVMLSISYFLVLTLITLSGQLRFHIKMLAVANIPFLILLLLVYKIILSNYTLPGNQTGLNYSFALFLRVTTLTALFQYVLNVPSDQLLYLFKKLGMKGHLLIIIVSSFSIWRGFISKADRIVTARLARGYLKNRNIFNRIRQIPFVIKPLLAGALISALERSASWKQRNLLTEVNQIKLSSMTGIKHSTLLSIMYPIILIGWLSFIILKF